MSTSIPFYPNVPSDSDTQLEYGLMLGRIKPWVKACGMSSLNQFPLAKIYSQVLNRLELLQKVSSHLNSWLNQIHDLDVSLSSHDAKDRALFAACEKFYAERFQPERLGIRYRIPSFRTAFAPMLSSLSSLMADHALEVEFCRQCLDQLDIYNTIDHPVLGSCEFAQSWGLPGKNNSVQAVWARYITASPAKLVRDYYFLPHYRAAQDEISEMLVRGTISSRRSFTIQRILRAIDTYHRAGWYMVFDTLTLADDRLQAFYDTKTALRDHFRAVGRKVLEAEGRPKKESYDDCFQYFCVPEYGTEKGRLHFHAVYFMRTLPLGSRDPNIGQRLRIRRQLSSLSGIWAYGYSLPIAVRYSGDSFTRAGWLWPQDKKGKAIPSKPPLAVGYYVAKYVNKKADLDVTLKNFKGTESWNKSIKASLNQVNPVLFRVRMSRNFGMNTPSMSNLKWADLIQMVNLDKSVTPYPSLLKQNAKREMKSRLASLPLFTLLDAQPETTNLLASLRAMTQNNELCNLRSFIASLVVKLTPTDISKSVKEYLAHGNLDPVPFDKRPTWSGGGK